MDITHYVYMVANKQGSVACTYYKQQLHVLGFLHKTDALKLIKYPKLSSFVRSSKREHPRYKTLIHVYKNAGIETEPLDMTLVPYDDFLAYPYEKCLGVICLDETLEETQNGIIFGCEVFEPSCDPSTFRNFLRLP